MLAGYEADYQLADEVKKGGSHHAHLREAAKIEAGMRKFLEAGGFKAFTTTFESYNFV